MQLETLRLLQEAPACSEASPLELNPAASPAEILAQLCQWAAQHPSGQTRAYVIRMLGQMAMPSEHEVFDTVLSALKDPDPDAQQAAKQVLLVWRSRAVPGMLISLRTTLPEDAAYRLTLIQLLGQMGSDAGAAWPLLNALQSHPQLGSAAKEALGRLRPGFREMMAWSIEWWMDLSAVIMLSLLPVLAIMISVPRGGWVWMDFGSPDAARPLMPWKLMSCVALVGLLVFLTARWLLAFNPPQLERDFGQSWRRRVAWAALLVIFLGCFSLVALKQP